MHYVREYEGVGWVVLITARGTLSLMSCRRVVSESVLEKGV